MKYSYLLTGSKKRTKNSLVLKYFQLLNVRVIACSQRDGQQEEFTAITAEKANSPHVLSK